jgi:DMSO/TMAO reductase YedYZ heme-binding membrane subunit
VGGLALTVAAGVAAATTGPGAVAATVVHNFLEFYSGVFCLVSLSITVMGGLAATDRIVLLVRHRVLLQAAHRALALTAMVFLGVHITMKIIDGRARPVDVVVPFLATHRVMYVGLGTVAAYLMLVSAWTGVVRGRFAGTAHPWVWRGMHSVAYLCWPVALMHGLQSGRHAKTWVTVSYVVCLLMVGVGLLIRVCVSWGRKLGAPRATTTGAIRPIGRLATPSPARVYARRPAAPVLRERPSSPQRTRAALPQQRQRRLTARPESSFASASDDEFWAYLRGEATR